MWLPTAVAAAAAGRGGGGGGPLIGTKTGPPIQMNSWAPPKNRIRPADPWM